MAIYKVEKHTKTHPHNKSYGHSILLIPLQSYCETSRLLKR